LISALFGYLSGLIPAPFAHNLKFCTCIMSTSVEDGDKSGDLAHPEASKADILTKETPVTVGEKSPTSSPHEAEGGDSAKSQNEDDTVYVNGHPVIENGMNLPC
jgi:hypothetical protein